VPAGALGGVGTAAVTAATRAPRPHRWPIGLAWALWALTLLALPVVAWLDQLLRQAGLGELTILQAASLPWLVALVSAATVGAVLASRRPEHPVGWLLLALGLSGQLNNLANQYVHYGVMGGPGALQAASYLSGFCNSGVALVLTCANFIPLLTPTGSLPSPRWRWWARVIVAATLVLLLELALEPHPLTPEDPTFENPLAAPPALASVVNIGGTTSAAILLAGLVVGAGSLVMRVRRARGIERQQLRWLAFAAAVAAVALLVAVAGGALGSERVVLAALGTCLALLPLATGAAILRYRLYDLDRIISRTLAYGLLTLLLGGGYAVVVLGLGQLLGRDSSLGACGTRIDKRLSMRRRCWW
jgi:hypothetical protein